MYMMPGMIPRQNQRIAHPHPKTGFAGFTCFPQCAHVTKAIVFHPLAAGAFYWVAKIPRIGNSLKPTATYVKP